MLNLFVARNQQIEGQRIKVRALKVHDTRLVQAYIVEDCGDEYTEWNEKL